MIPSKCDMKWLNAIIIILGCAAAQEFDYAQFVNPFIGSEGAIPGFACKSNSQHHSYIANNDKMAAAMCSSAVLYLSAW